MSELINKVKTKYEIRGEVQVAKVYPELENLTVTPSKTIQSFNHPDSYGYNNVVVKAIDCETLNVTPKKELQTFDGMYDKVNVKAIDCETLSITPKQEDQFFEGMYDKVNVNAIQADILKVTPSKAEQSFKGLYEQVNVGAIQGETLNVTPKKESQSFSGLYDTVNVEKMHGDTVEITPTEVTQTFNGIYENINVNAINTEEVTIDPDFSSQDTIEVTNTTGKYITKAILNKDTELVPRNILEGVNIYGIEGIATSGIDTSDATATAEDIAKDKTAYVNGEKIVGSMVASSGGVDTLLFRRCQGLFWGNTELVEAPFFDTSNVVSVNSMFRDCTNLVTVPHYNCTSVAQLSASGTSYMANIVLNCPNLSDESLNNIMAMCLDMTMGDVPDMRTLSWIGLSAEQRTRCKALPNWNALVAKKWTEGY